MGDEARDRELPQRLLGAARSPSAPTARPVMSEEVLQRLQAAVRAERGQPADQPERPVEPERIVKQVRLVSPDPPAPPKPAKGPPNRPPAPAAAPRSEPPGRPERPRANALGEPARRRLSLARVVTSALVVVAAGSLAAAAITAKSPGRGHAASAGLNGQELAALNRQERAARDLAAAWVVRQVSHSAVVSCAPQMCAALRSARFPARNLRELGPASTYPRSSAIVIETADVRALFGSSLDTLWAPAVLATFGSGEATTTIRVIAPNGAAAYRAALGADLNERKAAGAALLQGNSLTLSATARKQLAAGQVDSRLLLAITALATDESVDIVRFENTGPGGDADMPLRLAYLADSDPAAHMTSSAYVRSLIADLGKVPAPANSAGTGTVVLPDGQTVLSIEFTAPSPLGLISG
jgi:hypothetical protein